MIRKCNQEDIQQICEIINDAAIAYKGVIPADRWQEPYMPIEDLRDEIESGVVFWGYEQDGRLVGVMGIQNVKEVTLIRHAYVLTSERRKGIGTQLLTRLKAQAMGPVLIGTWAAAWWAIDFYRKHGFEPVSREEKDRLLRKYWKIPERQVQTSVVLAQA